MPKFTSNTTTPAVVAENTSSTGAAIAVQANDVALRANNSSSTAPAIAAEGGVGLRAITKTAGGIAVQAQAEGPNQALTAINPSGQAAFFASSQTHTPTVLIDAPGVALRVKGNVDIVGNLQKSGGGFRIDHPLEPREKYLNHSFVESTERKNVYDGVAVLDGAGQAGPKAPPLAVRDGERADVRGWWTRASAPSAARSRSRAWPGKRRMSTTRSRRTSRPGRPEPHEAQTFGQVDAERRPPYAAGHAPTVRVPRVTMHVIPIAPLVRPGVPLRRAQRVAVSSGCARSCSPKRHVVRSGQPDGPMASRWSPPSGLPWPEHRLSRGEGPAAVMLEGREAS
jgi:hypothetical protein